MTDQFVAEIRIFPFNFAPNGWAFCDGQLLPISQNTALFSLLGTTYGGDGRSNFALPNVRGSVPMHIGGSQPGPGLSMYYLGESLGSDTVPLIESEIPAHRHTIVAAANPATSRLPSPSVSIAQSHGNNPYNVSAPDSQFADLALSPAGSSFPHNNLMPYLTLNFCIALQGIFPPRS
ncbi:MAG: phage tail protein [Thermomicrobiales bacterium]